VTAGPVQRSRTQRPTSLQGGSDGTHRRPQRRQLHHGSPRLAATVEFDAGETERFLLVDPVEAPLDQVRISAESPLARALLGRPVGEQVEVKAPGGRYRCRILATRRVPAQDGGAG
jgi:hypothetical protein